MTRSQSQKSRAGSGLQSRTTPEDVRANPGDGAARGTPGTGEDVCPREPEPREGLVPRLMRRRAVASASAALTSCRTAAPASSVDI
jgi:hypothetical protein